MRPLQIVGLIAGVILLFPGLCFLGIGGIFVYDSVFGQGSAYEDPVFGSILAGIGVGIFVVIWLLMRHAFRKSPPPE